MKELKPCPFCGEKPEYEWYINENNKYWGILCTNKECVAPDTGLCLTKEEAVEKWNSRQEQTTAIGMIYEEISRLYKLKKKCSKGSEQRKGCSIAIDGYMKIINRLKWGEEENGSTD